MIVKHTLLGPGRFQLSSIFLQKKLHNFLLIINSLKNQRFNWASPHRLVHYLAFDDGEGCIWGAFSSNNSMKSIAGGTSKSRTSGFCR